MRPALILVGLGILAMMELEASPRTKKSGHEPLAQTTVGLAVSRDTLTAADRFEIVHVPHEATVQPISPVEPSHEATVQPISPVAPMPPDRAVAIAQEPSKTIEQRKRDAHAAVMLPRPRPIPRTSKPDTSRSRPIVEAKASPIPRTSKPDTSRSKPIVEAKACRPGTFDGLLFDGLLKALNLSSGCET
jgi:hypothetical protein